MSELTPKKLYTLDENAVAELVERYRAPLLFFVTGFLGDVADAEDAVSDTIVKLLLRKPLVRNEAALKTYLYKTAKHIAVDKLRKRKREKRYLQSAAQLAGTQIAYVDEQMGKTEEKQTLLSALRLLPLDYRQVLYFYYFEDLSIVQICKILHKNKKQIYNLLARAKTTLSTIIAQGGTGDEI